MTAKATSKGKKATSRYSFEDMLDDEDSQRGKQVYLVRKNRNRRMKEALREGSWEPVNCPTPEKKVYSKKTYALQDIQDINKNPLWESKVKPQRAYHCECGGWHLTSMDLRVYSNVVKPQHERAVTDESSISEGLEELLERSPVFSASAKRSMQKEDEKGLLEDLRKARAARADRLLEAARKMREGQA